VLTGGEDHTLRIYDINSEKISNQIFTSHRIITSIDTEKNSILTAHDDNTVRMWDSRDPNTKGK